MRRSILPLLLTLTFILAACAPSQTGTDQTALQPAPVSIDSSQSETGNLTRSDGQGEVTVDVTPLNLDNPSGQFELEIMLNTHSVDLNMDLATLSTLTTDTGFTVEATSWDAPRGGHHVEGKLIFPATQDGKSILEGSKKITLTILNLGVPSRIFEWELD